MRVVPGEAVARDHFDLVVIGSGFGSGFFLHEALRHGARRVLVVEWGDYHPHAWQAEQRRNATVAPEETFETPSAKRWNFTIAFGGGTNCWFAQTPRLYPTDFRLRSLYGVGADWPIDYDDLEPFYAEAEAVMAVSGDPDMAGILPRSTAFPQLPHRMSALDRLMKAAQPHQHFAMPTARARIATETRPACCASLRCRYCPVDAKFTAENGLRHVYDHPELQVALKARALRLEGNGGAVRSLIFEHAGREHAVTADLFVLGANAIHSPAILFQSGMESGPTGRGLHESYGAEVEVYVDGVDNFDGSTITTGINYSLHDGAFRREAGGALIFFENRWSHGLRAEPGKWRQTLPLIIVVEDLPESANRVESSAAGTPIVHHAGASEYARLGLERALARLPDLLDPLPVESIHFRRLRPTESHLQGTLRMGMDPQTSVVDETMLHHRWRNLVVVGTAVFPSCSNANPSLTAAALSLRAARLLLS